MRALSLQCLAVVVAFVPLTLRAQVPTIRDSAGIRIVESPAVLGMAPRFALAATPEYTIGGVRDNLDDELSAGVSYPFALYLPGNRILVAQGDHFGIFDITGHRVARLGRGGSGPGEFRMTQFGCRIRGDSLVVWDSQNRRISIWSPAGKLAREYSPLGFAHGKSCREDGTILTQGQKAASNRVDLPLTTYSLVSSTGKVIGTTPELPGALYSGSVMREVRIGGAGDRFYVVAGIDIEVRVLQRDGRVAEIWRTRDVPAPVTDATLKTRYMMCTKASATAPCEPVPTKATTWPSVYAFEVGDDGRLWLRLNHGGDDLRWLSFDATGKVLGILELPPAPPKGVRKVLHFGRNEALVGDKDADGASRIRSFRIVPRR
jgi:hypothetical protein